MALPDPEQFFRKRGQGHVLVDNAPDWVTSLVIDCHNRQALRRTRTTLLVKGLRRLHQLEGMVSDTQLAQAANLLVGEDAEGYDDVLDVLQRIREAYWNGVRNEPPPSWDF